MDLENYCIKAGNIATHGMVALFMANAGVNFSRGKYGLAIFETTLSALIEASKYYETKREARCKYGIKEMKRLIDETRSDIKELMKIIQD